MDLDMASLGRRIKELRLGKGVDQAAAAAAIGVSQPSYSRIESGQRRLKGSELVQLADYFQVRAAALTGVPQVQDRVRMAARTDGSSPAMTAMSEKVIAYLELDAYLTDQGIA